MVISEALESLEKNIDFFRFDPCNVRAHDQRSIDAIAASLTKFGQMKPIVCLGDGTVIAGNGTLAAARQLGVGRLAAVVFRGTREEAQAFAIADNRTAELSFWDDEALAGQLAALTLDGQFDFSALGFDEKRFSRSSDARVYFC